MRANWLAADAALATSSSLAEAAPQPASVIMDEQSFQAFFRQSAAALRAYVISVIGNAATADDIVQDAFLRLLRSPPATSDAQQLRAFLFRIASNLMTDYWRHHRLERGAHDGRAREPAVAAPNIPLRVDMARTFKRLRPQQRQLLWLAYVEGAEHREIAEALGLRPSSVRVLLYRARRKMAQLIDPGNRGDGKR
ncbi:MAG: RNA polymerase sigma factor [Acidobacteria bacterium]|nr:RNA polymerase sigma factor [Acidobacteriota bacterium]